MEFEGVEKRLKYFRDNNKDPFEGYKNIPDALRVLDLQKNTKAFLEEEIRFGYKHLKKIKSKVLIKELKKMIKGYEEVYKERFE